MEEPWDELMGPSPEDLRRMLSSSSASETLSTNQLWGSSSSSQQNNNNNNNNNDHHYHHQSSILKRSSSLPSDHANIPLRRALSSSSSAVAAAATATGSSAVPPPSRAFMSNMPARWAQRDDAAAAAAASAAADHLDLMADPYYHVPSSPPSASSSKRRVSIREDLNSSTDLDMHQQRTLLPVSIKATNLPIEDEYEFTVEEAHDNDGDDNDDDDDFADMPRKEDPPEDVWNRATNESIRQEALKVLEVADEQLNDSSYTVHRTITGGFAATMGNKKKRRPAALAALSFTAKGRFRKSQRERSDQINHHHSDDEIQGAGGEYSGNRFADDPYAAMDEEATPKSHVRDSYEYGEDSIVDVVGMERRSSSSRSDENAPTARAKNWSSRYSVDQTLLALSGGSISSPSQRSSFLDNMDKKHARERLSASNVFGSRNDGGGMQVFGSTSGFAFRQKYIFGKQNVIVPPPSPPAVNLATVYVDEDSGSSLPPVNQRTKSWQEQLKLKQRQRLCFMAFILTVLVLTITLATTFRAERGPTATVADMNNNHNNHNNNNNNNDVVNAGGNVDSISFYATGDTPLTNVENENKLLQEVEGLSTHSSFFVHLGNLQDPAIDACKDLNYTAVRVILESSPIPAFIVPGQADWIACPNKQSEWGEWMQSFRFFHSHFNTTFDVQTQSNRLENFAFVQKGVLFVGVHVVNGGSESDYNETQSRNLDDFRWIRGMTEYHTGLFRAMAIFGNARPGQLQNEAFFNRTGDLLSRLDIPAAYIHANLGHGEINMYKPFPNAPHAYAIQISHGLTNPPLRITVGFGDQPFVVG